MDSKKLEQYFHDAGWTVVHRDHRKARDGVFYPFDDLGLEAPSLAALRGFHRGIYRHQREAIERYLEGHNLAVTTPTASGKTMIFNVCALEELSVDPKARIAAVYPLKALAAEQTERWQKLVADSGINVKVGRIDGGVQSHERLSVLKESRVVVMTPDIIHAWLLSSIDMPAVREFLANLTLLIADEAHTYSGVFGSNSAFLFRRLLHATRKLGGDFNFIASSATMEDPQAHLHKLTGEHFDVIGADMDSSARSESQLLMVNPPRAKDLLSSVSDLITFAATQTSHQSITFVDSRKQTEYLASIVERRVSEEAESDEVNLGKLEELQVYPYRSGYEEDDRTRIQKKLALGSLKGVVSTSALEMGIDLPYLTLGILFGIPRSATSLFQRIGRVGRKQPGVVIIVNNGSVVSESVFRDPARLESLPLLRSALYLHNQRIQYIHAMCLAQQGGEDQAVSGNKTENDGKFTSPLPLPDDFAMLCEAERVGEVSTELQSMKAQAGDDPHHTFPLRNLDAQFKVQHQQGPNVFNLGSLSMSQLLREAYPGAVYYYQTKPYRIVRIRKQQRIVEARPEKRYFTAPLMLQPLILPNLSGDNVHQGHRYGSLLVIECALQVREAVCGFTERRGNNQLEFKYPLDPAHGLFQDAATFPNYSFTSGVIFTHPALSREGVRRSVLAEIIQEAFLMSLPFERQDISAGADKHRATRDPVTEGDKFICVYDQTYGSLRLTSHLMKKEVLRDVFTRARDIALNDANLELNEETVRVITELAECVEQEPSELGDAATSGNQAEQFVPIVSPGSIGINVHRDNEEFEVDGVFFSPQMQGLAYRGRPVSGRMKVEAANRRHSATTIQVPIDHIRPLNGESKIGYYSMETGEMFDQIPFDGEF
ncbi:ATP-dependent RNA helicase SrmB [Paraburkholderia ultramafica]|uniref:ATP-dependent RNA helicase SrmB n=1 Tax=Paraburkholderia ultramafica TaxID=1544867 RepID=A0A6S7B557_9BURK|nr:DEAD/DEAH box helicase [Paraburkholderia ultramafica]CAB3785926.1 ATP-dependent RNA helicase SrmB [Paraburkholderia ultramafica]